MSLDSLGIVHGVLIIFSFCVQIKECMYLIVSFYNFRQ